MVKTHGYQPPPCSSHVASLVFGLADMLTSWAPCRTHGRHVGRIVAILGPRSRCWTPGRDVGLLVAMLDSRSPCWTTFYHVEPQTHEKKNSASGLEPPKSIAEILHYIRCAIILALVGWHPCGLHIRPPPSAYPLHCPASRAAP